MYKDKLIKKFFDDNFDSQISAQQLIYAKIEMPEISDKAAEIVNNITDRAAEQAKAIEKEEDPEVLFKLLRGKCDPLNDEILHRKVLEREEELGPKIINMLVRSGNDGFVEHAVKIITQFRRNYTRELLEILDDIRYPYTLSIVCIAIGFIGDEEVIPVIYNKFFQLKELYKNESYDQGPLWALYKLNDRFYKQ